MVLEFTTKHFKDSNLNITDYLVFLCVEKGLNSKTKIQKELNVCDRTVFRALKYLRELDIVEQSKEKGYKVTNKLYPGFAQPK